VKIERLRLVVEQEEAGVWALRLLAGQGDISGARLGFEPNAVVFEGRIRIPLAGDVPFRTVWSLELEAGARVIVRLTQASAFGWSGGSGFLTGLIMEKIKTRLAGRAGFEITGDSLILDPGVLLTGLPVEVRLRVTSVTVEPGRLILETG